jgi:phage-related protein
VPLHHVSHSFSIVTLFLHAQVERIKRESPHGQQKGWALRGLIVKSGDDCRQVRLEGVHSHMHPFIVTCTHPFIVNSRDDCRQVRLEGLQSHAPIHCHMHPFIVKSGDDCRQVRLEGVHSHMHPFIVTCTHPFIVNSGDDCRQVRLEGVHSHMHPFSVTCTHSLSIPGMTAAR